MARAMCNHLEGIFSNMQNILVFTIWIALVDKTWQEQCAIHTSFYDVFCMSLYKLA